MIVKLEDRKALIDRAKELMNKYSMNAFEAVKWAEKEFEKQMKMGELENE